MCNQKILLGSAKLILTTDLSKFPPYATLAKCFPSCEVPQEQTKQKIISPIIDIVIESLMLFYVSQQIAYIFPFLFALLCLSLMTHNERYKQANTKHKKQENH